MTNKIDTTNTSKKTKYCPGCGTAEGYLHFGKCPMKNTSTNTSYDHIPTEEINQDIADTQREIEDYQDEKDILMRNPQENRTKIYLLEGRISQMETFIKQLNMILSKRTNL